MTGERGIVAYLEDILDAAGKAMEFVAGMTFDQLTGDTKTLFAVVKALEIIGEATRKIPRAVRARYAEVPWQQMAGMQDKLVHDYGGIDVEMVWKTMHQDLPPLRQAVSRILAKLPLPHRRLPDSAR